MASKPSVSASTRLASAEDLPALTVLLEHGEGQHSRSDRARKALSSRLQPDRLSAVLADPTSDVILAESGGAPVGMAVVWLSTGGPLHGAPLAQLSYLVVAPSARRKGLGRAMVAAAAAWAEEHQAEHLVAHVYPGLREANRFYARLGFAPVTVRRVASVQLLRRQLGPAELRRAALAMPRRRLRAGGGVAESWPDMPRRLPAARRALPVLSRRGSP